MKQNIFAIQVTKFKNQNILITSNWETSPCSLTAFWTSSYSTGESQFNSLCEFSALQHTEVRTPLFYHSSNIDTTLNKILKSFDYLKALGGYAVLC